MKNLVITTENFGSIRESLKAGESVNVNNVVVLTGYKANTEKVNANGKKTRTPFYYISESNKVYTSTTLKALLGIEAETKGERKETTFASIWEQAKGLASNASIAELKEAAKFLQELAKQKAEEAKKAEAEEIKSLEARLKALKAKQSKK
jgi:hypothetical protein